MPIFLAPWFLLAAAAVAVPVALHLLWRRKPQPVPFSSLRFLQQAVVRTRRSRQVNQILLLLLRMLILLLLALAFARPKLALKQGLAGGHRNVLILLDASASMQYRQGTGKNFDLAKERAERVLAGLGDTDKAAIFAAGLPDPRAVFPPTSDKAKLRAALPALQAGFARTDLRSALLDLLKNPPPGLETRGLEVHVCGDFQTASWPAAGNPELARLLADRDALLFLNQVRPDVVANAGIRNAELHPPSVAGAESFQVEAALAASPDWSRAGNAALLVNGQPQDNQPFTTPEAGRRLILRGHASDTQDPVGVRVDLSDDAFAPDNTWYLVGERSAGLPIRIVRNTPAEGLFAEAAVKPGSADRLGSHLQAMTWTEFAARDIAPGTILILCNPPVPDHTLLQKCETLLAGGSLIVVFPGDAGGMTAPAFRDWPALAGLTAVQRQGAAAERAILLPSDQPCDLEKRVRNILTTPPALPVSKRLEFGRIPAGADAVLEFPDRTPFLVGISCGNGNLWLCSLSADRTWSDLPVNPLFVVLNQELLRAAAGRLRPPLATTVGESVAMPWPESVLEASFDLVNPAGKAARILPRRRAAAEPFLITGFTEPGIWQIRRGDSGNRLVAVNLPSDEADLTYHDLDVLAGNLKPVRVLPARTAKEQEDNLRLARFGRPFWPTLLTLAFIAAVLEIFLANWIIRSAPARHHAGSPGPA